MAACNTITGVPKSCDDNNKGSITWAAIAEFDNVTGLTVTSTGAADTDGNVTAVTMVATTKFEEFYFPKDTSSFAENMVVNFEADTHGFQQVLSIGLRRLTLRKRNAIMLLAEGRRDLIAIVRDANGDYWMLGSDEGLRLSSNAATTNATRAAGQATPIELTADYEAYKAYKVDAAIIPALLLPAAA